MDVDFVGNSSNFHHLITAGKFTKDELSFGMNLRSYKNTTQFNAQDAWRLPGPKCFSPRDQYSQTKTALDETNKAFSSKFKDKHAEKNAGEIMHMVRSNDVYENIGWMTNLRGDRASRKPTSVAKSPKKNQNQY